MKSKNIIARLLLVASMFAIVDTATAARGDRGPIVITPGTAVSPV